MSSGKSRPSAQVAPVKVAPPASDPPPESAPLMGSEAAATRPSGRCGHRCAPPAQVADAAPPQSQRSPPPAQARAAGAERGGGGGERSEPPRRAGAGGGCDGCAEREGAGQIRGRYGAIASGHARYQPHKRARGTPRPRALCVVVRHHPGRRQPKRARAKSPLPLRTYRERVHPAWRGSAFFCARYPPRVKARVSAIILCDMREGCTHSLPEKALRVWNERGRGLPEWGDISADWGRGATT